MLISVWLHSFGPSMLTCHNAPMWGDLQWCNPCVACSRRQMTAALAQPICSPGVSDDGRLLGDMKFRFQMLNLLLRTVLVA